MSKFSPLFINKDITQIKLNFIFSNLFYCFVGKTRVKGISFSFARA